MLKRIAILFTLTGFAHIFSIMALKFMAQRGSAGQMVGIGDAESLIQFMIGLIGFGMQSDALRNIALDENWKEKLRQAQTARNTLGLLLVGLVLLSFSKSIYVCFFMAPLLASSCDYALYGRGSAIVGAWVAFIRVTTPLVAGILAVFYWPQAVFGIYVGVTFIVYLATNIYISWFLDVSIFFPPKLASLKLYLKTLPLGIINLSIYFFGLGILLLAQLFYDEQELVISFLALKFYAVYKGALRVIHQAFIRQMKDERVCQSVDHISIMMSLAFFGSVLIFPGPFISLFFGSRFIDHQLFFILLSLAAVSFSIFNSCYTRLVLEKKDYVFMKIALASVFASVIFLVVTTFFSKKSELIPISLLVGETFFSCCAALILLTPKQIGNRIVYLLVCSLALGIPILAKLIFEETLVIYFASFILMGGILLFFSYKNLKLPVQLETANLPEASDD